MTPRPEPTLWLLGMMGSGKTAVGREVALLTGFPFVDLDAEVEQVAGMPIAAIFSSEGEAGFRRREREALLAVAGTASVVATGGGTVLDPRNVTTMRETGTTVWLAAGATVLAARVGDGRGRPLLSASDPAVRLEAILAERLPLYRQAAEHEVDTEGRGIDEVAREVRDLWTGS